MGKSGFVLPFLDQVFLLASAMLLKNTRVDCSSGHVNYYPVCFWGRMHCKIRHVCLCIYICICFGVFLLSEYKSADDCEELVINAATTINNLSYYQVKNSAVQDKKLHIAESKDL